VARFSPATDGTSQREAVNATEQTSSAVAAVVVVGDLWMGVGGRLRIPTHLFAYIRITPTDYVNWLDSVK
jgi:hypothetical protein